MKQVLFSVFNFIFSSPEHAVLMVSYCGQSMSVLRRQSHSAHGELLWSVNVCRASSVVRRGVSIIALKAYSSYTLGPVDSILGRKHRGDL